MEGNARPRGTARWPLLLIAAAPAVAIWSGWVAVGGLCGFGPVRLLPGITDWTLNTAITLPVGVEAYAAYALGAWMSPGTPPKAARFAKWSALGALAYGMAGQVIYHLLAAAHATAAPWPVVVVVSCMPVAVLGLAAALTHMLRLPAEPGQKNRDISVPPGTVPSDRIEAAKAWYAETLRVGNPAAVTKVQGKFSLTRKQATEICTDSPAGGFPVTVQSTEGTSNGRQGRQADRQRPGRQAHQDPRRGQQPEGRQGQVVTDPPAGAPPEAPPAPAGALPAMNGRHGT